MAISKRKSESYLLLVATTILLLTGLLVIYSTTCIDLSAPNIDKFKIFKSHILNIGIAAFAFIFFRFLKLSVLKSYALEIILFSISLLILVLFFGKSTGGATRWLSLGFTKIQPGEILKLSLLIYISSYISNHEEKMKNFFIGIVVPFTVMFICSLLLLKQPDLGSCIIIFLVTTAQLFLRASISHLFSLGAIGSLLVYLAIFTSEYRIKRVTSFRNPLDYFKGEGYQLSQSLIAIGTGGLIGVGLGNGKSKLNFLPAAHTDFIYSVIAEELGFMGAIFILSLFLIIGYAGLMIAKKNALDSFKCSLALGCTALIMSQALLNIGVVIGILPTKGMVLPFVAYGGSALLVHLSAIGLLLNINSKRG